MPLLALWKSDPDAISQLTIDQIVAIAGDGRLRDGSPASSEIREFFGQSSTEALSGYANHCLSNAFTSSGLVLQDVVNELGRRLDYSVEHGRYQGTSTAIGFDGLWHSPEGHSLVIEVKTTDAYRISLDSIAQYSSRLFGQDRISKANSILIIVGRKDTGELEAQVRGSRHAWDVRLISVEALLNLVGLKESTDDFATAVKMRSILQPREYTRLDALIDVMFTAAKDIETGISEDELNLTVASEPDPGHEQQRSGQTALRSKRTQVISALARRDETAFVRHGRALSWDDTHTIRVACTISKRYDDKGPYRYWYAYHPKWDMFLSEAKTAWFCLGCIDLEMAFILPFELIHKHLADLSTTPATGEPDYWHIHIIEAKPGQYCLDLPKRGQRLSICQYMVQLVQD